MKKSKVMKSLENIGEVGENYLMNDCELEAEELTEQFNTDYTRVKEFVERVDQWCNLSDADLRLRLGEMTAQELRTVKAVLNSISGR